MRVVVKVEPAPNGRHVAVCSTGTCAWISAPQVVKAAAEELARIHRNEHRRRG